MCECLFVRSNRISKIPCRIVKINNRNPPVKYMALPPVPPGTTLPGGTGHNLFPLTPLRGSFYILCIFMKTGESGVLFAPERRWLSRDWLALILVAVASIVLMTAGLSVRSLWGSEGRWAVVAREMIASGNYFLPTINGEVYFDKPLLSYWMITLFARPGVLSEAAARLPSALSGVGCILLIFAAGRRLFGLKAGLLAGGLLLTTVMFTFWARTASAELPNLLCIWLMIWAFMAGGVEGRLKHLLLFYGLGAVAAFLKGPVAPAVALSTAGFYSLVRAVLVFRSGKPSWNSARAAVMLHFRWILSFPALVSVASGLAVFAGLLLLPVIVTGSWQSVELMWRENVLRFFRPFDHVEPPYAYLKHGPVFFLPWTVLLLAALWESRNRPAQWAHRFTLLAGLAIFLFFSASGSRRSYYILPLVPALALITAKALSDWIRATETTPSGIMKGAVYFTGALPGLSGLAVISAYFVKGLPHHPLQLFVGLGAVAGSVAVFLLLFKGRRLAAVALMVLLFFFVELWVFTGGMAAMEEMRTFKSFCRNAATRLTGVASDRIALYPGGDSSLVYYLNRSPLKTLATPDDVGRFRQAHPDGILITEARYADELRARPDFAGMTLLLTQDKERYGKKGDRLVVVKLDE